MNNAIIIGNSAEMTREQWLSTRKHGIGGSDASYVFGVNPWGSPYDLFLDKTNPYVDSSAPSNWFRLQYGNVLEPLVREWYAKTSGYSVVNDTYMYIHPTYQFMLADVDFIAYTPTGEAVIGEIKTTNERNAYDSWAAGVVGKGGKLPYHYEVQVRHYMAVLDLDRAVVLCCYGNDESCIIPVQVYRDKEFENTLISAEYDFWVNHVLKGVPPVMANVSADSLKSVEKQTYGNGTVEEEFELPVSTRLAIEDIFCLETKKKNLKKIIEDLDGEINAKKVELVKIAGNHSLSKFNDWDEDGHYVEVVNKMAERNGLDTDKLKLNYPEVYEDCKKITSYPQTTVKLKKTKVAKA